MLAAEVKKPMESDMGASIAIPISPSVDQPSNNPTTESEVPSDADGEVKIIDEEAKIMEERAREEAKILDEEVLHISQSPDEDAAESLHPLPPDRHYLGWQEADQILKTQVFDHNGTKLGKSSTMQKLSLVPKSGFGLIEGCEFQKAIYYPRQYDIPRTALASYPGSGLNWLRILLQKATGFLTTSVYPESLPGLNSNAAAAADTSKADAPKVPVSESVFQGAIEANRFLVKTHYPMFIPGQALEKFFPSALHRDYDRAIYLMRNPFDAIYCYYYRHEEGIYQRRLKQLREVSQKESGGSIDEMNLGDLNELQAFSVPLGSISVHAVRNYVSGYLAHYQYWRETTLKSFPVKYESIQADPKLYLKSLVDYLVPMPLSAVTTLQQFQFKELQRKKLECTLASDLQKEMGVITDIIDNENFSLKYYSKEALYYMATKLKTPLCEYGYAEGLNAILGSHFVNCQ